jgi:ATP-dependent exoDNAse (exonuclease V) beta subunit
MAELAFSRSRPRERLRRLRLVVEQARAFAGLGQRSLRVFIEWMQNQMEENARMVEIPVPEADEDAVRIMTMHASKGLEFPVVILAGLDKNNSRSNSVIFNPQGGSVEIKLGSGDRVFATSGYEEANRYDQKAQEAEGIRLMYVATTRARDYLLLSCFRKQTRGEGKPINACIEEIAGETGCSWQELNMETPGSTARQQVVAKTEGATQGPEAKIRWLERREDIIRASSLSPALAVTALAYQKKEEGENGTIYFRKGRGGTSLGRAVHSVLQTVDLATGKDIEQISRSQADVEGIPEREKEVTLLAGKALEMSVVKRAVQSGRYWREVFVSLKRGSRQIEGFIDLIFEEDGCLVIADYKTDVVSGLEDPANIDQYQLQAGLYALAASELTGKPVREVALLFLNTGREIIMQDIDELKAKASHRIEAVTGSQ